MGDIFKAFMVGDIVDNDYTMRAPIVTVSDGAESLLAGSVPLRLANKYQNQFALFAIHIDILDFLTTKQKITKSTPIVLRKFWLNLSC